MTKSQNIVKKRHKTVNFGDKKSQLVKNYYITEQKLVKLNNQIRKL